MDLNNVESPFSFDLGDELLPLPSLSCIDNCFVPQFPSILENNNNNSITVSPRPKNGRRKKPPANTSDDKDDENNSNEHKKKKIMHRDVERQRRQEMSSLYSTLRSLLPIEYLKGKRSICDHMHETVKYIRYMQSKIQELCDKRDELKKLQSNNQNPDMVETETLKSTKRDKVVVRARDGSGGIQVILDTATRHRLPLSNILVALTDQGLEILSCSSNKLNDRFLHTIESQPVFTSTNSPIIDVSGLQYTLTNLEYCPLD
ncbi:hypothetical protein IC582_022300 [Cucumis melo]|nr:transcription factor bHLH36-like [Cucumis melo]KAA0042816.1 transcription factor bHLH36-like [Cucumis melo var. makuwa]